MMLDPVGDLRRLRERSDWLLTVLTAVLTLVLFVFAPLQASGISVFHGFAIGGLLAIIGSMVFISDSPTALVLMSIALIANLAVFFLRLYYPLAFHLHILAGGEERAQGVLEQQPEGVNREERRREEAWVHLLSGHASGGGVNAHAAF